ncbi:hypothetical protein CRYUN_Cryun01aG0212400 [Craigia yunnanensis]
MRPVFVGNFEYETRQCELERLFSKYGRIERVDVKSGFAFVYFEDERDAEDAICGLDNSPFGYDEWRLYMDKFLDRVVSVEYAFRGDDERDDRYDSPRIGGYGRQADSPYGRSPSPAYRRRPSPDYGRARSPVYDRYNGPAYDRHKSP